jgi:hypothetical protein
VSARSILFRRPVGGVALWALLACAPVPPAVEPGTGSLWGELSLVPRAGVVLPAARDRGYADPRLADVRLVDYSQPGFAVVYLDAPASSASAQLAIRETRLGARLEPGRAVIGTAGSLEIANLTDSARIVSSPQLGLTRRLAPGERIALAPPGPGELRVHLPGSEPGAAIVFASPGPFAIVARDGQWRLTGVEPGRARLHAWHPRFPPAAREIEIRAGSAQRVDLALGVDVPGGAP